MIFRVSSSPYHSMILRFCDSHFQIYSQKDTFCTERLFFSSPDFSEIKGNEV